MFTATRRVAGFTLVELLVSISILATISIVGYVSAHSYMMKANNSERMASMDALKSGLNNYYQVKKTLPEPNSNHIYYDERGTYVHSASGSFGVSGHASRDFYPAEYANTNAFDPETKQFFGYGKLSDNSAFDIATALYVDAGVYKAYVDGTYDGGRFPSLVRAYHSSDFVSHDSTEFLPYNPFERKVTAKIITWSGTTTGSNPSIWIGSMDETTNPSQPTCTKPSPALSLTGELMTGDCIGVGTGSTALLHISDGSELSLGSTGSVTILELKDLRFKDSEDPVTSVLLKLMSGEVWAEAPRYREINENESEMQIYTTTALAAVRGTVFGVSIDATTQNTVLSLASGEIEVGRNPVVSDGIPLFGNVTVTKSPFENSDGFSTTATGGYVLSGSTSSMIVPDGGTAISLTVIPPPTEGGTSPSANTGSIDSSILQQKLHFLPFGMGYIPRVISITTTGAVSSQRTLVLRSENPGADWYTLSYVLNPDGEGVIPINSSLDTILSAGHNTTTLSGSITDPFSPITTLSGSFTNTKGILILSLCKKQSTDSTVCSHPLVQRLEAGELALDNYGDTMRLFDSMRSNMNDRIVCPDGQRKFASFGCQPNELVAFAPYNHESSHSGSLGMFTMTKDQNLLVGEQTFNPVSYPNKYVPEVNNSGVLVSAGGTSCTTVPTGDVKVLRLTNLHNILGMSFFEDHGLFRVSQAGVPETRGVYVDNCGTDSYLKYNLAPLNLGDKFAIEVNVRGGALKRTDTKYYLWYDETSQIGVFLNPNSAPGKLGFSYPGFTQIGNIPLSSLPLNDNDFYPVRFERRGENIIISIAGIQALSGTVNSIGSPGIVNIGSTSVYSLQWNDIIDGVRIYRLR